MEPIQFLSRRSKHDARRNHRDDLKHVSQSGGRLPVLSEEWTGGATAAVDAGYDRLRSHSHENRKRREESWISSTTPRSPVTGTPLLCFERRSGMANKRTVVLTKEECYCGIVEFYAILSLLASMLMLLQF